MPSNPFIGMKGEEIACRHLSSKGYGIVARNFRSRYGEIDIIARKGNTYVFTEVKTRTSTRFGEPYEAVTAKKASHFRKACQEYVLQMKLQKYTLSMHVVSIVLKSDLSVLKINHFEDLL